MKKFILIAVIAIIGMMAINSQEAKAAPVKVGIHWYKGSSGNWYWVEHYTDYKTGFKFSKIWTNGDGPDYNGGHSMPSIVAGGSGGDNPSPTPDPNYGQNVDLRMTATGIEIKTAENVKIDIINLADGTSVVSDLFFTAGANYQALNIPTLTVDRAYGILIKRATNNIPVYSQVFYLSDSGYYFEPNE